MRISDWSSDVCSSDLSLDSPLTIASFAATGLAIGPVITGALPLAAEGVTLSLVALVASIWRLRGDARVAHGGTAQLYLHRLRTWTVTRVVLGAAGLAAVLLGAAWVAVVVDRKSVVSGKRVPDRVDLGGRRLIHTNN